MSGTAGSLFGHRDFRLLWTGDTISQFGTQVSVLALPLVAVLHLRVGPQAVGALVALEFVAFLTVGLPAGAWCDRRRARPIMITADLVRCLLLLSVPVAAGLGVLTIWQLYAVILVQGTATTFFDVAYQSYLPRLVRPESVVDGNAKLQASAAVAQVAGPSLAGLLIQALTAPVAVVVDGASYLVSAASVAVIRHREVAPRKTGPRHLGAEIAEGLRIVRDSTVLRTLAVATAGANFFMAVFSAVILVFLARELRLGPGTIGLLMSVGSLGGIVGAAITSALARRFGPARAAWIPFVLGCPLGLLIPLTGHGILLACFVAGWFAFSFAFTAYNVAGVSLRQLVCPARLLGRMNATMRFLSVGVMPLGALIGGALATALGPRETLWIDQIGLLLVPVFLLASPLRTLRDVPAVDDQGREGEGQDDRAATQSRQAPDRSSS